MSLFSTQELKGRVPLLSKKSFWTVDRICVPLTALEFQKMVKESLKIALNQLLMARDVGENADAVIRGIHRAGKENADLALFPELATTGYHLGILDVKRNFISDVHDRIAKACKESSISALVGSFFFDNDDDRPMNATLFFDKRGRIQQVIPKIGLTEAEKKLFRPGSSQSTWQYRGWNCMCLLCIEVWKPLQKFTQGALPRVIFWPGFIMWSKTLDFSNIASPERRVSDFAVGTNAFLVQANWANRHDFPVNEKDEMGKSFVVLPSGAVGTCLASEPCEAKIELGPEGGVVEGARLHWTWKPLRGSHASELLSGDTIPNY